MVFNKRASLCYHTFVDADAREGSVSFYQDRSTRSGSEDVWSASGTSSITDVSNLDTSKDEGTIGFQLTVTT